MSDADPPRAVLQAWSLEDAAISPLGNGLINRTWVVTARSGSVILQRVNPVFPPQINEDIDAVTRHLRARGLTTPELLPATGGRLWVRHGTDIYRLMTRIEGISHERLATPEQARSAGELLARFHRALADLGHEFRNPRLGVHDTARHLENLRVALETRRDHPHYDRVRPQGEAILALAGTLPPLPRLPDRVVHGDPKINNILFDARTDTPVCLVDLDTLGRMPLPLELGDAFRSWCNPRGEDHQAATFSLDLFDGAVTGYAGGARGWISPEEWQAVVPATLRIYVELAARFCADALNECYFGWDPARFADRSTHNQVRAASQIRAAKSLQAVQDAAAERVAAAFAGE